MHNYQGWIFPALHGTPMCCPQKLPSTHWRWRGEGVDVKEEQNRSKDSADPRFQPLSCTDSETGIHLPRHIVADSLKMMINNIVIGLRSPIAKV